MVNKVITVNRKGMITIPSLLRKKYKLKHGSQLKILDIEGKLEIIPIYEDFTQVQKKLAPLNAMKKSYEESIKMELELEDVK